MSGSNEVEPVALQHVPREITPEAMQHAVLVSKELLDALDAAAGARLNLLVDEKRAKWQVSPPIKILRVATAALAGFGLLAANLHDRPEKISAIPATVEAVCPPEVCAVEEQPITAGDPRPLIAASPRTPEKPVSEPDLKTVAPQPVQTTTTSSPPASEPKPTVQAQTAVPKEELSVQALKTFENINNMKLTREGLVQALTNVRTDFYEYAQSKPKFNPEEMEKQGIPQGPTEFYTEHVSAGYYNEDGTVTPQPLGNASIKTFIDKISERDDPRCCGVNQYINRDAVIYWLAPRAAKLRHNSGYDGQTTGKEVEGYLYKDLTPQQLEASAYVDIGNLFIENLYDKDPTLKTQIRGHAKSRQDYNDSNPNDKKDIKIDGEEPETEAYRQQIRTFIAENPDWKTLIPIVFLDLP